MSEKMSKYELIDKLTSLGFEAGIIDGLPYILNVPYDVAERAIKSLGYEQSWGVKNGTFMVENCMSEDATNEVL